MKEWIFVWPSWVHSPDIVWSESFGWKKPPNRFKIWFRTQGLFGWFWTYKASKKARKMRLKAHIIGFVGVWFGRFKVRTD